MATAQSQPMGWKDLYVAALLEGDKEKVHSLIDKAEHAIVGRVRELFDAEGDNAQEQENLDDALYGLHALKTCLTVHGTFADAA